MPDGKKETELNTLKPLAYNLAMLGLQSDRYQKSIEFKEAVDDVLSFLKVVGKFWGGVQH